MLTKQRQSWVIVALYQHKSIQTHFQNLCNLKWCQCTYDSTQKASEKIGSFSVFSSVIVADFFQMPVFVKYPFSSNARLLQMLVFFRCPPASNAVLLQMRFTRSNSLSVGYNAGDTIMIREVVRKSGHSHLGWRPPMVSVVKNAWKCIIMTSAVLTAFYNWTNLLWCGWARWQAGGTLLPEGSCSSCSLPF